MLLRGHLRTPLIWTRCSRSSEDHSWPVAMTAGGPAASTSCAGDRAGRAGADQGVQIDPRSFSELAYRRFGHTGRPGRRRQRVYASAEAVRARGRVGGGDRHGQLAGSARDGAGTRAIADQDRRCARRAESAGRRRCRAAVRRLGQGGVGTQVAVAGRRPRRRGAGRCRWPRSAYRPRSSRPRRGRCSMIRPGPLRRDLHRRLGGLHLDQRLVLGDHVTLGDQPLEDLAPRSGPHRGRERELSTGHRVSPPKGPVHGVETRSRSGRYSSSSRAGGYGRIEAADPQHRRLQRVEALLGDAGRDLCARDRG